MSFLPKEIRQRIENIYPASAHAIIHTRLDCDDCDQEVSACDDCQTTFTEDDALECSEIGQSHYHYCEKCAEKHQEAIQ